MPGTPETRRGCSRSSTTSSGASPAGRSGTRRRGRYKRGGDRAREPLDAIEAAIDDEPVDVVALDEALDALAARDERMARIVELRFFAGLDVDETARALDVSPRTVKREWAVARACLRRALGGDG